MTSKALSRLLLLCISCAFIGSASSQEVSQSRQMPKISVKAMAALLLDAPTPEFPRKPMAKCSNAMVTLDAVVGADGHVDSVKVVSGFEEFRDSALAAVKQWVYKPYVVGLTAEAVQTTILVMYPSGGTPSSLYVPDGKGGVKGGESLPLGPGCGPQIKVERAPSQ